MISSELLMPPCCEPPNPPCQGGFFTSPYKFSYFSGITGSMM